MHRKAFSATATILISFLAGCAPSVSGTPAGGVVDHARPDEAMPLAQAACQKHGKDARISGFDRSPARPRGTTTYDCV